MSCEVKSFACIANPNDIRLKLIKNLAVKIENLPKHELPLQDCLISLSSAGDTLAIALHKNIVILTSKWDLQEPGEVKNKFYSIWSENFFPDSNEFITSILCLPLISLGKSSSINNPDWTCIAVGFSSGLLRFYTETGSLLLEEQLHNESILGIKFQSFSSPKHVGDTGLAEEFYVIYEKCLCIFPGFPLFSTLRAYRNHLARVQANCNDHPPTSTLTFKKLGFKDQDVLNDAEVIGSTSVNTFDHLLTASICGGFSAAYRSSAPAHNLVMATGKRPYIGFHFALEGGTAPVFSDVAIAMASSLASAIGKIGTAVPWFRNTKSEKPKGPVHEVPEPMTCRFGLSDIMREGDSLIISPNKTLSVITDTLGRVILVNNRKGLAVRMWKGYRDAQCGWIEVSEEQHKSQSNFKSFRTLRSALFLVIYAPKKGVIDIWGIQTGGKITTFSASKTGKLLYVSHGLGGLNDVTPSFPIKAQHSCVFFDPLGGLKEILVPFHFSLSSENGKRARDVHLFKKLKTFIREEEFDDEKLIKEVENVCSELKTNEIKLQILEMLRSSKHSFPDVIIKATGIFLKNLKLLDDSEMNPTGKLLMQISDQVRKAVKFYQHLKPRFDQPPEYITIAEDSIPDVKQLSDILLTSEREIERIVKLFDHSNQSKKIKQAKVTFKSDRGLFLDFISCLEFGTAEKMSLKKNLDDSKKYTIASLIFQGWMYSKEDIEVWEDAAKQSGIRAKTFLELALTFWLNKLSEVPIEVELIRFTHLLHSICALADVDEICVDYSQVSSWWNDARIILMNSNVPLQACTAALACRSVAVTLQKMKDLKDQKLIQSDEFSEQDNNGNSLKKRVEVDNKPKANESQGSPTGEWESVSKDVCQFSLIIGNLEDIANLYSIISEPPAHDDSMTFLKLPSEKIDISLSDIISKGKGAVSEIVACWLATSGIDPSKLIDTRDREFDSMSKQVQDETQDSVEKAQDHQKEESNSDLNDCDATSDVLDKIKILKKHFPYSLSSSVILANLAWEYVMFWSKDISSLAVLEAALVILKQIPMKMMRQGVCCLLWTIHINKKMEAAAKLINKIGKLPKERLCCQEIGLSDIQTTEFLRQCVLFLDIFLDAEVLEEDINVKIKSEELWEGFPAGPQAFAATAVEQTPAGFDLVMLHLQLAYVLHMMAHFSLKSPKPMTNLFESVTSRYFFSDISNKVIIPWYHDDKQDERRSDFLCRVITASMESIHQETIEGNLSCPQTVEWMGKCQTLSSIWKINNDKLRIHQVCQLYINGFDRLAEEVMTAVNDTEILAENLLSIAGRRMMVFLSKTPDLLEEVSRISPALTQYLENLNTRSVLITNCSNENNIELIKKVSRVLPETHSDYHIAQLMLDAIFIYEGA
ncbi:rab3 GTPase-activating protein non-catalytic subunit [Chelonus insularis]|uniref:rab3 GTPase-activating protein non-catalytic subunit n=1 Tax=Chelonus insularis TaxID=460826 RepID=UPI00158F328C|nr:rab3 GTPase-activating protein non-catalytic subunit [Chelonus insularis]